MFTPAAPGAGQGVFTGGVTLLAVLLLWCYARRRGEVDTTRYHPALAWLRAGLYFCACLIAASASGVLAALIDTPLATASQLGDPRWWLCSAACLLVILVGYAVIWPLGTFTDGRQRHAVLSLVYGSVWGACQALWFLTLWAVLERTGLAVHWVAIGSYLLIGTYNGLWHRFFWDIQVSPPHNVTEWNARKVLLCHTPNLVVCLAHLALYGNAAFFVLMQTIALAVSAYGMRFPAWWDDYRATPGLERSLSAKPANPGAA